MFVDVDGVISLFGFDHAGGPPPGQLHLIDGILHCIGHSCRRRLAPLLERFELVWATGWEERANEYLPHLLGIPELPVLRFDGRAQFGSAHWKLEAIEEYAGSRAAAWIDDSIDEECVRWAAERSAPTLLIRTESGVGIDDAHVDELLRFADSLGPRGATSQEPWR